MPTPPDVRIKLLIGELSFQVCALQSENERLEEENRQFREENAALKKGEQQ